MRKNFYGSAAILLTVLCVAGCVNVEEQENRRRFNVGVPDGKFKYKPVDASALTLKMISKPIVTASTRCTLNFAVANTGTKSVQILEWMRNEPDNLVIYAQPWLTQMTAPDPQGWIKVDDEPKRPVYHYPMILKTGNQALITKELPFIEKLRIAPGEERRFFIRAESNLTSLKLATGVIGLRVLPKPLPSNQPSGKGRR